MNAPLVDKPDPTTLMIRRSFDADMATLWRALTEPEAWMHWFGGGHATPIATSADLRRGGAWRIEMLGEDSADRHIVEGEYLEVEPPRRVSFTWAWYSTPERVSRVTYALTPGESDGQTTLTLHHERFFDAGARDNHGRGWTHSLERLAAWLGKEGTAP